MAGSGAGRLPALRPAPRATTSGALTAAHGELR